MSTRILANRLRPGMVLAENIYSLDRKRVIASKGSVLTEELITSLKLQTAIEVLIETEESGEDDVVTRIARENARSSQNAEPSHMEKLRDTPAFKQFKRDFEDTFSTFGNRINDVISSGEEIRPAELSTPVFTLIHSSSNPSGLFDMLHSLRQYSDETYAHSVNVALISNAIGQWMGLPEEDLTLLTQAGLLHDIGKLLVPGDIIKKPGKLTKEEYVTIQEHPQKGYNLIKNQNINEHIKNAVLMHHERCDASGYPSHLLLEEIDSFARYVAIADVYDAITSARVYRDALCPFVAIQILESEGLQKYDTKAIMTFLNNVVNTYLFNRVRLNDGRIGDIVFINKNHFAKPTIRVGDEYIDLAQKKDLSIEQII